MCTPLFDCEYLFMCTKATTFNNFQIHVNFHFLVYDKLYKLTTDLNSEVNKLRNESAQCMCAPVFDSEILFVRTKAPKLNYSKLLINFHFFSLR